MFLVGCMFGFLVGVSLAYFLGWKDGKNIGWYEGVVSAGKRMKVEQKNGKTVVVLPVDQPE